MSAILKINHYTKIYSNHKRAVDDLTLSVDAGEICAFIGHNGAGKSTTIKAVVGIHDVPAGRIFVDGQCIAEHRGACQRRLAYIPDNPDLFEYMTGISYINFICDMYEQSSENRTRRVKELADDFEITDQLGDIISSYSHGMKQKVALIAALAHEPRLLVLDEPFVGLDPKASAVLKRHMRNLCDNGSAIFFSTHVLEVAERLCDRVAIIDHGRLIVEGAVAELTKEDDLETVFLRELEAHHA